MKISAIAAISLDGKIALHESQPSLEWTSEADTKFFVKKTKEIGTLVMGRKTFETIGKPLPGRKTIVMTRSPEQYSDMKGGGLLFTDKQPEDLVASLKDGGADALAVVGGTEIYSQFTRSGLIDEWFLTMIPVWFDEGVPLLSEVGKREFSVKEISQLDDQTVLFHLVK